MCLGDGHHRGPATHEFGHVGGGVGGEERAALAVEQGEAATGCRQPLGHVDAGPDKRRRIELPGPAVGVVAQGVAGDVVEDEAGDVGLFRDGAEVLHRLLQRGVGPRVAESPTPFPFCQGRVGPTDGCVHQDHPGELRAVVEGRLDGDQAAQAVPHDYRGVSEGGVAHYGDHFGGPGLGRVGLATPAVPVATEIEGCHPPPVGEERGEEGPPVGVGRPAVDENQAGGAGVAPVEVVDGAAPCIDEAFTARGLDGSGEPGGDQAGYPPSSNAGQTRPNAASRTSRG